MQYETDELKKVGLKEEELDEAEEKGEKQEKFAKNQPPYDKATAADRAGPDGKHNKKNEAQIRSLIRKLVKEAVAKKVR